MCGITGAVWNRPDLAVNVPTLERMTESIRHRGPDDAGTFTETFVANPIGDVPGVALGFRRLSIIDLAGGHQPLANEDQSIWVVFNGEIYNFKDLRKRLEGQGHRFSTNSDTETIVHLYEDLGVGCFEHFNGMFAIAIWDRSRRKLVLGRDRIGQKPLFYRHDEGRLLFGSELKALREVAGLNWQVDPGAIDEFLTYQYIPHPNTIYQGVRKLPPAHYAVYQNDRLTVERYWKFDPSHERSTSEAEAIDRVRERLTDSVRLRLQADVPVGAFLSGGIDSSVVVAIAQGLRDDPIRTFSIGFPVADFDETAYAAHVAKHLGTAHQRFEVAPDAVAIIDRLVWHYDEPFADSSAIPTWYLSELTKREVTVALSGDGGDELFAGYDRYRALYFSQLLDRMTFGSLSVAGRALQWLPDSHRQRSLLRRAKRFGAALGQPTMRRYLNWIQIFPERLRADLYRDEFVEQLPGVDPFEFLSAAWRQVGNRDLMTQASLADLLTYLPCDLNTKVDIASMAHGLEVRQPMLDYRFVELASSLPIGLKYRHGRGKWLLKRAFGERLPEEVWTRPKMGFGVPIADWFRGPLRPLLQDRLQSSSAKIQNYFHRQPIDELIQQHLTGQVNHCYRLWALVVLEAWLQRWQS
jgi:asparagine synthase (glutamine-hydrolysing)